jgi:predicted phage terminase large subunit-like protein
MFNSSEFNQSDLDPSHYPDVSIVMPCLNEARWLPICIANAQEALDILEQELGLSGEILIADNGSTDGGPAIALSLGARVVHVSRRGYGAALIGGFSAARGRYLVMGDADGSYDFRQSLDLVRRLTEPKPNRILVRGSTYDNKANLPQSFFDQLAQFEGTVIGRQELEGELIDPEESGVIKRSWLRLWPAKKNLPVFDWIVLSLDTAFTEATTDRKSHDPDYSACAVFGGFRHKVKMPDGSIDERAHVLLLDCWQEQLGLPELVKRVKRELNVAYGDDGDTALIKPLIGSSKPVTSGRKPDIVVIEDKGSGISLRQVLDREGIASYAYNPGRADKLTRLHIVSPVFARRQVWLPESDKFPGRARTWTDDLVHQLCSFTGRGSLKHDDYVDAVTQALRLMMDKNMLSAVKAKPEIREPAPPRTVVNPYAA